MFAFFFPGVEKMSAKIQAPKGAADTLPVDVWRWQSVERIARSVAELYGFKEIRTPIFEHTELFHRGVGETSDIVSKETYTFDDRGGRSLTLRPEGTASVVRAAIEHSLLADQGARLKLFYIVPNFRYERPAAGRYRQHHQFGVEVFGVADPEQDAECILLQMDFYRRCGLRDLELQINSLGDGESKGRYREVLVKFLTPRAANLSEDSQRRLTENPLRILDSKDPRDQEACVGIPPANQSLSPQSQAQFEKLQKILTASQVPFRVNANLVRGFDYYTDALWEVTAGGLGAQNAVGGGGRYDNLVERLGGRPTPGVGFGSGLERLLIALESQGVQLPDARKPLVWIVVQSESAKQTAWKLLADLRAADIAVDMDVSGRSVKSQFKLAERETAKWSITLGDTEVANQSAELKNMGTREQVTVPLAELVQRLGRG